MPITCLVGEKRSELGTLSPSLFWQSQGRKVSNVPDHQGKPIKEGADGNLEENRIFSSPSTKREGKGKPG